MYHSTSQEEVFEPRIFKMKAERLASFNQYIQQPDDPNAMEELEDDDLTVK